MTACRRAAAVARPPARPCAPLPVVALRIGIIADDFTSAMDGAGPFVAYRAVDRATVVVEGSRRAGRMPSCVSIDIDSRSRPAPRGRRAHDAPPAMQVRDADGPLQDRRLDAARAPRRRDRGGVADERTPARDLRARLSRGRPDDPRRRPVARTASISAPARSPNDARQAVATGRHRAAARSPLTGIDDPRRRDGRRPRRDRRLRRRRRRALGRLARTRARPRSQAPRRRTPRRGRRSRRSSASPSSSGRCTR